jgi:hypothetical protein
VPPSPSQAIAFLLTTRSSRPRIDEVPCWEKQRRRSTTLAGSEPRGILLVQVVLALFSLSRCTGPGPSTLDATLCKEKGE